MPPNLCSTRTVRSLLLDHDLAPNRGRGQSFLIDRNTVNRLLALADLDRRDTVLDLGSGLGVMAGALAPLVSQVIAVEVDEPLLAVAKEIHSDLGNIRWVLGDLRELSLLELVAPCGEGPLKVVSNLPYSISKLVLRGLLDAAQRFERQVLMVQREVGDRMIAAPGTKAYGPLSLACCLEATVTLEAIVSPNCFYPRPSVQSAVMKVTPLDAPRVARQELPALFDLIRSGFAQRRKTLVNALASSERFGSVERISEALVALDLDLRARAESLRPEDFVALYGMLRP